MPVHKCRKNNKPGFKWGSNGTCYTYTEGNERSMDMAKNRALRQGRAINANRGRKRE